MPGLNFRQYQNRVCAYLHCRCVLALRPACTALPVTPDAPDRMHLSRASTSHITYYNIFPFNSNPVFERNNI